MMPDADNFADVDERVERLICRLLDNELQPDERWELNAILAQDEAARQLLDEYTENDRLAREALLRDLGLSRKHNRATAAARTGKYRGLVLASAGAVLSAAAVIALSFLPSPWEAAPSTVPPDSGARIANRADARPMQTKPIPGIVDSPNAAPSHFVDYSDSDYRNMDYYPRRRTQGTYRDVIGVRRGPNTIILLERQRKTTRVTPINGEL